MKEFKQKGSTDCGLFAIAVITSLAHKEDPNTIKYKMRQHLMDCFSYKFLMIFQNCELNFNLMGDVSNYLIVLIIHVYCVN